ncbi:hypothetical protein CCUG60884_00262 [Mycobacteroides salmoniphilum]|uniref:Uncharacterized protein n=1 Tax=Mycobacteroides salmoniphilum TaxID=404941 RepID=A0A4R8SZS1_9MYCO|nr:hypothetical protein CCUG60884_00262 [Mycobacteroides salmoniphilum]
MTHYRVSWEIDVEDADTPEAAAREALGWIRQIDTDDPDGVNIFSVRDVVAGETVEVDLGAPDVQES